MLFDRIKRWPWKALFAVGLTLLVVAVASLNSEWVDVASAQVSIPAEPAVESILYRVPAEIDRATANVQWFNRVALGEGGDSGDVFRYVVWLHVPSDWQLQWATTFSFTGDFTTGNMTKWYMGSVDFIENSANCTSGGPANFGYKWQAWAGAEETLPPSGSRTDNEVNLRGGLWVPDGSPLGQLNDFRLVVGTYYDSSGDGTPDTYKCDWASFNTLTVVDPAFVP